MVHSQWSIVNSQEVFCHWLWSINYGLAPFSPKFSNLQTKPPIITVDYAKNQRIS
jgi:hypothetical protein